MASMGIGVASMISCEAFPPICLLMIAGDVALSITCGIRGMETGQEAETDRIDLRCGRLHVHELLMFHVCVSGLEEVVFDMLGIMDRRQ